MSEPRLPPHFYDELAPLTKQLIDSLDRLRKRPKDGIPVGAPEPCPHQWNGEWPGVRKCRKCGRQEYRRDGEWVYNPVHDDVMSEGCTYVPAELIPLTPCPVQS